MAMDQGMKRRVETAAKIYWRRSSKLTLIDHIPKDEIKRRINVTNNFIDNIAKKQLIGYGHVKSTQENRVLKEKAMAL